MQSDDGTRETENISIGPDGIKLEGPGVLSSRHSGNVKADCRRGLTFEISEALHPRSALTVHVSCGRHCRRPQGLVVPNRARSFRNSTL